MVDGTTTKMWWGGRGPDGQDNIYYAYKPEIHLYGEAGAGDTYVAFDNVEVIKN